MSFVGEVVVMSAYDVGSPRGSVTGGSGRCNECMMQVLHVAVCRWWEWSL